MTCFEALMEDDLEYLSGFGNEFSSESLPGALPKGQNNPRICPYGLYAEQLSGTPFTMPRKVNLRSWLYRIRPSVTHEPFEPSKNPPKHLTANFSDARMCPNQIRWNPFKIDRSGPAKDFVQGLVTICGQGDPLFKEGYAIHVYTATASMDGSCLANADGDYLIVPQLGRLRVITEFGVLIVAPGELCVVQRGMRFAVHLLDGDSRGYVLEIFQGHFVLPDLGPIGANGLANPRDFRTPVARYEEREGAFEVMHKFGGELFSAEQPFSPFNVVAWHGNYAPYKYDLKNFCPVNAVAFDHPDPSIFTVLTVPSPVPGQAVADVVVFPPRWAVAEHTFRPPYFHRNVMTEFMGLIRGEYDGKESGEDGFSPGGASLHSCMSPHGPDTTTFDKATQPHAAERPQQLATDALAFMFEMYATPKVAIHACNLPERQRDYYKCWQGFKSNFEPSVRDVSDSLETGTTAH